MLAILKLFPIEKIFLYVLQISRGITTAQWIAAIKFVNLAAAKWPVDKADDERKKQVYMKRFSWVLDMLESLGVQGGAARKLVEDAVTFIKIASK